VYKNMRDSSRRFGEGGTSDFGSEHAEGRVAFVEVLTDLFSRDPDLIRSVRERLGISEEVYFAQQIINLAQEGGKVEGLYAALDVGSADPEGMLDKILSLSTTELAKLSATVGLDYEKYWDPATATLAFTAMIEGGDASEKVREVFLDVAGDRTVDVRGKILRVSDLFGNSVQ